MQRNFHFHRGRDRWSRPPPGRPLSGLRRGRASTFRASATIRISSLPGHCRVCTCKVNGRNVQACVDACRPWHGGRKRHRPADRRPANHHRDAFRRRQSSLPVLREEWGLRAAGARLSPRHGGATASRIYGRDAKIDATHPDIYLDRNRCILCSRCIRASRMEDGKSVFGFEGRGIAHAAEHRCQGRAG